MLERLQVLFNFKILAHDILSKEALGNELQSKSAGLTLKQCSHCSSNPLAMFMGWGMLGRSAGRGPDPTRCEDCKNDPAQSPSGAKLSHPHSSQPH